MHQQPTTYSQLTKSDQTNPHGTKKTPQSLCPSVIPVVKDFSQPSASSPDHTASSRRSRLSGGGGISPANKPIAEAKQDSQANSATSASSPDHTASSRRS